MSLVLEPMKAQIKDARLVQFKIYLTREQAYLGRYKEAIDRFTQELSKIKQFKNLSIYKIRQLRIMDNDPVLVKEWKRLFEVIQNELEVTQTLYSYQKGLVPVQSPQKNGNKARAQECPEPSDNFGQNRMPFNQVPFQHHQNQMYRNEPSPQLDLSPQRNHPPRNNNYSQDIGGNASNNYQPQQPTNQDVVNADDIFYGGLRNNSNNYQPNNQYQKKSVNQQFPNNAVKDPDVWDPAPNKPSQKKKVVKQPQKQSNPFKPQEQQIQKAKPGNGRAGYDKPWLNNAQKADKSPVAGQDNQKKFLYHHYPEGTGPDMELINMLEREVVDKNPCVNFEDIAELDEAKDCLQEAVLLPIFMPQFFTGIKRPIKGALLYGPPGTGKTMLAKAVATIGKTTFFNVSASSLASKWKGESEKLVRLLFEMARFYAPSTIFFDEIDAIGSKRGDNEGDSSRKVKTEMLTQMDGVAALPSSQEERKIVMVLAATNRPWDLDEALIRRLERRIYIPPPEQTGRKLLFQLNLQGVKVDEMIDWNQLVLKTEGYSGADISNVCREASMLPMRRKLKEEGGYKKIAEMDLQNLQVKFDVPLAQRDFEEAIRMIPRSVSNEYVLEYPKWRAEFGNV